MNEIFLLILMFLGILFGYFISKISIEELKEITPYIKYAHIVTAAIALSIAVYSKIFINNYYNILISIVIFLLAFTLIYLYKKKNTYKLLFALFGLSIFFVKEQFFFAVAVFIDIIFVTTINYKKNFFKNALIYLYFLIPALLIFLVRFLLLK